MSISAKVKTIGNKLPVLNWQPIDKIGKSSKEFGGDFEKFIFELIDQELEKNLDAKYYTINQPENISNDKGRDIVVKIKKNVSILGQHFHTDNNVEKIIFFECKYRKEKVKIHIHDIASGIDKAINSLKPDYYILVTNTTLDPKAYYDAKIKLSSGKFTDFFVFDQYKINKHLNINKLPQGVTIEYQAYDYEIISTSNSEKQLKVDVYLFFRNFSDIEQTVKIRLISDETWSKTVDEHSIVLAPYEYTTELLSSKRLKKETFPELKYSVQGIEDNNFILINAKLLEFKFEPPFVGKNNKRILEDTHYFVGSKSKDNFFFITGEAGSGKTRIVDELIKEKSINGYKFFQTTIEKNKTEYDFFKINKKINFDKQDKQSNQTYLKEVQKKIYSLYKHVYIIDDFHNASSEIIDFFESICRDNDLKASFKIIIVGRDDYTFSNNRYISFLSYTKNIGLPNFLYKKLTNFNYEDAHEFVIKTTRGLTNDVKKKIINLGQNIPFGLTQAIQYLLDTDLTYLMTRETIGIPNAEKFSSKIILPNKLTDLIQSRLEMLEKKFKFENQLNNFFIVNAYFTNNIQHDIIKGFFHNIDYEINDFLYTLVQSLFIKKDSHGFYTFYHDNIRCFFLEKLNDKNKCKEISEKALAIELSNPSENHNLILGQLYTWNNKYQEALEKFGFMQKTIENQTNLSASNISSVYFDYIDDYITTLEETEANNKFIKQALKSKLYISLHTKPLGIHINNCDAVLKKLNEKDFLDSEVFYLEVLQKKAHATQNMGYLASALKLMDEVESRFVNMLLNLNSTLDKKKRKEFANILFDLYNRKQDLHIKYNDISQSEYYGSLARKEILILEDEKKDKSEITELQDDLDAKSLFLLDTKKANLILHTALNNKKYNTPHRNRIHTKFSAVVSNIILNLKSKKSSYDDLEKESNELLDQAIQNSYTGSIMRGYLIVATIKWLKFGERQAHKVIELIEKGIDSSIIHGYSTYIWYYYNLLGIVYNKIERQSIKKQMESFLTSYYYLDRQGLLFLGNRDNIYSNTLALDNIIKFLTNISYADANQKISKISFYLDTLNINDYNKIETSSKQYLSNLKSYLFKNKVTLPIDPHTGFNICLT